MITYVKNIGNKGDIVDTNTLGRKEEMLKNHGYWRLLEDGHQNIGHDVTDWLQG
jgi:hypothetical protein